MKNLKQNITTKYLLYLVIFLIPFYFFRFTLLGFKTNIFEVFTGITFIVFVVGHVNSLTIKKFKPVSVWAYVFLLASLIGLFVSNDKIHALGIFKGWFLFPVILYILVLNNFTRENISKISIPLFASLMIVSVWAILQKFGIIGQLFYQAGDAGFLQYIIEGRAFGPFGSPNYLAMFLVPTFFLSWPILEMVKRNSQKLILATGFLLSLMTLVFSQSRAGMIAFIVSALFYFNYRFINLMKASERKPFYSGLFVSILVIVNIIYLNFATMYAKTVGGGDEIRIDIYRRALHLLKDNYFIGVGLGDFQTKIAKVVLGNTVINSNSLSFALHPHNLLLAMWLNLGFIGLVLFMVLLIVFFRNVFTSNLPLKASLIAAMMAILIHGLFDTTYFKNDLSAIFWLIFAISFNISTLKKNIEEI